MRLIAFSIYDVKSETFSPPFFKTARGAAIRDFKMLVNDKQSVPGQFPDDYKLVALGEFDDSNAEFVVFANPESLGFGGEYKNAP